MNNLLKTLHPLSEADRLQVAQSLAALQAHRSSFTGEIRDYYDEMCRQTPIAAGIDSQPAGADGWWLQPSTARRDRALVFIHGGAYMLGSAQAYRGLASQLAARSGWHTFVPDYPLAPEHPFPAAPDAIAALLETLLSDGIRQIALVGDSAGGALSLAMLENPRIARRVSSAVIFSPWTDLAFNGASFNDPATRDPIFQPAMLTNAAEAYLHGGDARQSRASPLYARPAALPPLLIQVGSDELLRDDATRYAELAARAGGEVQLDIYEGLHHVFQRDIALAATRQALDAAAAFINRHAAQE